MYIAFNVLQVLQNSSPLVVTQFSTYSLHVSHFYSSNSICTIILATISHEIYVIMNNITVIPNVLSNDVYRLDRVKKYVVNAVVIFGKFVHCV